MTLYLQEQIDKMDITDVQKDICRRAIWYTVIKDYSLKNADSRARKAYNVYDRKIKTKKYMLEVMNRHLGEDYFEKKEAVRTAKFFKKINIR
jgi:hypothetical protein